VPFRENPVRFFQNPVPFRENPVRFFQNPVPFRKSPVRFFQNPVPFRENPVRFFQNPVRFHENPMRFFQKREGLLRLCSTNTPSQPLTSCILLRINGETLRLKTAPFHPSPAMPSIPRLLTLSSLGLCLTLSSCVVAPYGPGCAYQQPCGYGGGGYGTGGYGAYAPPAEGTVGGALLGAAAGGIIGHQRGRGLEGAALGGLLGALAGGTLQNSRQSYYHQPAYYAPPQPAWQPDYGDPYAFDQ